MALGQQIVIKGITDLKFTPEGGTAVDLFGAQSLKIDGEFDEQAVKGDDTILDYFSSLESNAVDIAEAVIDLSAFAALTGNSVVDNTSSLTLDVLANEMPYGKLEGQATKISTHNGDKAGDIHFVIYKIKVNKFDTELKVGDTSVVNISAKAIPETDKKLFSIVVNQTATDIT